MIFGDIQIDIDINDSKCQVHLNIPRVVFLHSSSFKISVIFSAARAIFLSLLSFLSHSELSSRCIHKQHHIFCSQWSSHLFHRED